MCSHCLFPVVDKFGTNCYHLVTRLMRQLVRTTYSKSVPVINLVTTSLTTTLLQLVCRSVTTCAFLRVYDITFRHHVLFTCLLQNDNDYRLMKELLIDLKLSSSFTNVSSNRNSECENKMWIIF
jgi:hypothetical protein